MNGEFERNSSYPYTVAPEGGYANPTGRHIVMDVRTMKQVGKETYPDVFEASKAIGLLKAE